MQSAHQQFTTLETILKAAAHADMDDACRLIQDFIGVTDGGLAGAVFSDINDEDWKALSPTNRHTRLRDYLITEIHHLSV